ncbi:hypothetical protein [Nocardia veterana]|uniref:Uncharacterized protein n=1 Tax=Nocardia veterana TaxID=132249 RepID=A0A7X6RK41_9NOCA|nr:hypothetical protein [Nocardia veterana]NKY88249.1 hypothetical protein [Nocardia veterana]
MRRTTAALLTAAAIAGFGLMAGQATAAASAPARHQVVDPSERNGCPPPPTGPDGRPLPPPRGLDGRPLPPPTGADGKPCPPPLGPDGRPLPPPPGA